MIDHHPSSIILLLRLTAGHTNWWEVIPLALLIMFPWLAPWEGNAAVGTAGHSFVRCLRFAVNPIYALNQS